MKKEEYLEKKTELLKRFNYEKVELEKRFNKEKRSLDISFAKEHCPVKIGDIVTDHYKTVKVEKFILSYDNNSIPCASFRGIRMTKDGKPMKRNADDNKVFLQNVTEINGKLYMYIE